MVHQLNFRGITIEGCLVVDDELLPGYFGREPYNIVFLFFLSLSLSLSHELPFASLAATPLADAFLLIDVISKAAQKVSCLVYVLRSRSTTLM